MDLSGVKDPDFTRSDFPIQLQYFAVIDTETNSLDPKHGDILSIAVIVFELMMIDAICVSSRVCRHHEFFNNDPTIHNTPQCLIINKITDEERIANGEHILIILTKTREAIGNCTEVYAYNKDFDRRFIEKYMPSFFEGIDYREISVNKYESVVNALQRMLYKYSNNGSISKAVRLQKHLHSALDDVMVEGVLVLHNIKGIDVQTFIYDCGSYYPKFAAGKLKNCDIRVAAVIDPSEIYSCGFNNTIEFRGYMQQWIQDNIIDIVITLTQFYRWCLFENRNTKIMTFILKYMKKAIYGLQLSALSENELNDLSREETFQIFMSFPEIDSRIGDTIVNSEAMKMLATPNDALMIMQRFTVMSDLMKNSEGVEKYYNKMKVVVVTYLAVIYGPEEAKRMIIM